MKEISVTLRVYGKKTDTLHLKLYSESVEEAVKEAIAFVRHEYLYLNVIEIMAAIIL